MKVEEEFFGTSHPHDHLVQFEDDNQAPMPFNVEDEYHLQNPQSGEAPVSDQAAIDIDGSPSQRVQLCTDRNGPPDGLTRVGAPVLGQPLSSEELQDVNCTLSNNSEPLQDTICLLRPFDVKGGSRVTKAKDDKNSNKSARQSCQVSCPASEGVSRICTKKRRLAKQNGKKQKKIQKISSDSAVIGSSLQPDNFDQKNQERLSVELHSTTTEPQEK